MNNRKAIILLDEDNRTQGEVINIIICDDRGLQGLEVPENQIIWDCSDFAVNIGDKWVNGVFYRENEPVEQLLSREQMEIINLQKDISVLEKAMLTIIE